MKSSQRLGAIAVAAAGVLVVLATSGMSQSRTPAATPAASVASPTHLPAATLAASVAASQTDATPQAQAVSPTHAADLSKDYPVRPVPFTSVHLDDVFWMPKIETNRQVTIPFAFQQCEITGRVDNFIRAATALRGEELTNKKAPGYPFDDTDIYKVIEGASYTLSVHPDPKLDAYVDDLIAKIAAAQEKDGYLYTTRSIDPEHPHKWAGTERWQLEKVDSHELYDLGHLYEAAVAHYQATGKRTLLDIALRTADLLTQTFGPGKRAIWPGHQITEMGLAKLYRVTGREDYLQLAKFMLDERGPDGTQGAGREYNQSHLKVVDQTEAVGHAVRATYMYSGMADVAALTGDASYVNAVDKIWENVVGKKLYITGGIGATGRGEAFGANYELPNMTAYNETCAAVGNDFWNYRLFLLHADAKYIDVMERTLYNGLISGVSIDGKSFFYPNPLESIGQHARAPWFGVACCPGNITRFMASVPGYVYAHRGNTIFVNLYAKGTGEIEMDGGRRVTIAQETRYPWDGAVHMTVTPAAGSAASAAGSAAGAAKAGSFTINVRIPGWARGEPVPSDLYRFEDKTTQHATLEVNGKPVLVSAASLEKNKGYVAVTRQWKAGDVIDLNLPMPVRRVVATQQVEADRERVALQRGPLVYALEWPDNPNHHVRNLVLAHDAPLTSEFKPDLLNGVEIIKGKAVALSKDEQDQVHRQNQEFVAIPYYSWANRGRGEMEVWLATTDAAAKPTPPPTVASTSKVTISSRDATQKSTRGINDGEEPTSSADPTSYFDWWPKKGSTEWIEYAFDKTATVSQVDVYWFDDEVRRGEVRVPASWRLLYKDGADWKPVATSDAYGVAKDQYNKVTFTPVTTTGLRLEITMKPNFSAGVQEWKVR